MSSKRRRSRDLALAIRRQKRVVLLLGFAVLLPAAILGVFGLRALEADRFRIQELLRREQEEALRDGAARIRTGFSILHEDLRRLAASNEGMEGLPGALLRASPSGDFEFLRERYRIGGRERDLRADAFGREILEAERVEFQSRAPSEAAERYRRLARSADPFVRSSALLGLARASNRLKRFEEALASYRRLLQTIPEVLERETAAHALMASLRIAALWREKGDASKAMPDLLAGYEILVRSRWVVSSELFRYYAAEIERELRGRARRRPRRETSIEGVGKPVRRWNPERAQQKKHEKERGHRELGARRLDPSPNEGMAEEAVEPGPVPPSRAQPPGVPGSASPRGNHHQGAQGPKKRIPGTGTGEKVGIENPGKAQ